MKTASFTERLESAARLHTTFCLGVDPSDEVLEAWRMPYTPSGLRSWCSELSKRIKGRVGIVKPQIAYFERFGSKGLAALEQLLGELRERGTLVLIDAKRGDIGNTSKAYGQAFLSEGAALQADAITANPYLGFKTLLPLLERAESSKGYVFVVVASSNPEGVALQNAKTSNGETIIETLISEISRYNAATEVDPVCGAVIGATRADIPMSVLGNLCGAWILCPGIGAQGGSLETLRHWPNRNRLIPTATRSILLHGVDEKGFISELEAAKLATIELN